MTSPSLPSEYHVMRNCVCAKADDDNNVSDASISDTDMAAIDISRRTTIQSLPEFAFFGKDVLA